MSDNIDSLCASLQRFARALDAAAAGVPTISEYAAIDPLDAEFVLDDILDAELIG